MNWSRKNEHIMESLMDVLNIKLRETIREEKGGTYGVRNYHQIYRIPESHYSINIRFGCNPERVSELLKDFYNVTDSLKNFGPDETVITKIKEIQKRQRELRLKENGFWLGIISDYLENNEDPLEMLNYYKWVDEITPDDIKKAANDYLGENIVKVILYPENKK
jgi:zinc protease